MESAAVVGTPGSRADPGPVSGLTRDGRRGSGDLRPDVAAVLYLSGLRRFQRPMPAHAPPRPVALARCAALPLALALLACGGDDASPPSATGGGAGAGTATGAGGSGATGGAGGEAGTGGSLDALKSALTADGFAIAEGRFEILDLSTCCQPGHSCQGNNPASPYAAFRVPAGPGQTEPNPGVDAEGLATAFRLREDEAVVYVGRTPPAARYFGFTPYLVTHGNDEPFASLSETLNDEVIGVDGAQGPGTFDRPTVVVAAANAAVDQRVRATLVAAGYPEASINTLVFDETKAALGLDAGGDTVGVLFRVALFDDAAAGQAFLSSPPGAVLRVSPTTPVGPDPMPAPAARPKNTTDTETSLAPSVEALHDAIVAAHPGFDVTALAVAAGVPDPDACIAGTQQCHGDNRDTIYPITAPMMLFQDPADFYVVYGVNHEATGKATYSSFSIYAIQHLVGIAGVTSAELGGSAEDYLPTGPDTSKLYAWTVARDCTGLPHCLAVPEGTCPSGIDDGQLGLIAFRAYVEPGQATAPDPATMVIDRVLRFRKP